MNISRHYSTQDRPRPRVSLAQDTERWTAGSASPEEGPAPLQLLVRLLMGMHRHEISYCYWKSSRRVHVALAGETDLDLLVARRDKERAEQILLEHGCKLFPSVPRRAHPAVLDFLGYDDPSGRIVHVHLHIALIVGESLLKNYRLPWEAALLGSAIVHPTLPIRTLDPVDEAILLLVRTALERCWRDPVALRRRHALTEKLTRDRQSLAERVDGQMIGVRAAGLTDEKLARILAEAFEDPGLLQRSSGTLRRIRRGLSGYRDNNALEARLRGTARGIRWGIDGLNEHILKLPRPWRRCAPGGGIVVAVLGVDGSGKTSVTAAIRQWLGAGVDVLPIYFGTGDGRPSLLLLPFKMMVPLVTSTLRTKPAGASHGNISDRPPSLCYSAMLMIWATILAVEKRLKLAAARRGASRGMVVIGDRYPQDQLSSFNDGPLLPRLKHVPASLRRFEASAYALTRRLPPELVIKLMATPAVLSVREPNMKPDVIRERVMQLQRLTYPGAKIVCVDAERPLAEVIRVVKHEIWCSL